MKIVLDTNVLVSALIQPEGIPARILDRILRNQVKLLIDHRIFTEYEDVLSRPEFAFPADQLNQLFDFILQAGERVYTVRIRLKLADPADEKFLEVAKDGAADFLVTGNLRHFPARLREDVQVISPREWWNLWKKANT